MKKRIKNKYVKFILNFTAFTLIFALSFRYFPLRGKGAQSWYEIYTNLPFILITVIGAFVFAFGGYLFLSPADETDEDNKEKETNMKRSKKVFVLTFLGTLFLFAIVIFNSLIRKQQTWEEIIYKDLPIYIICSLICAIITYFASPVKVKDKENKDKNLSF